MDRLEYCEKIQSKNFLPLVTDFFDQTMSLYHIGCTATEIKGNIKSHNPVFELAFNNDKEANIAQEALRGRRLEAFNRSFGVSVTKHDKNVVVQFLETLNDENSHSTE